MQMFSHMTQSNNWAKTRPVDSRAGLLEEMMSSLVSQTTPPTPHKKKKEKKSCFSGFGIPLDESAFET